jgi:hypothetical protein
MSRPVVRLLVTMKKLARLAARLASKQARLVRRCERAYDAAIRAEENAATEQGAWRLAKVSERCLRDLQAVRAGLPLPERQLPRTARNLAKQGLAALATLGRSIARALRGAANLRKAQAATAARLAARKVARLVRQSLRAAVRSVARRALALVPVTTTKKEITFMKAPPKLAARIHAGQGHNYCQISVDGYDGRHTDSVDGGGGLLQYTDVGAGLTLRAELRADYFVFTGGRWGAHSIAADETITSAARLLAHWQGYVATNVEAVNGGVS